MGGNGKLRRWRISFYKSSSAADDKEPPQEFLCPISNSLMFDPVVVSSGQTFERVCVNVCRDLGFNPTPANGSTPDFSAVIPNLALRTAILSWCSKTGSERPNPPVYSDVESIVRALMNSSENQENSRIRGSERGLLKGVAETPPVLLSYSAMELNPRNLCSSSSSEESVIPNATPLLPFATRPSCFSYSSSPSTSSEFVTDESPATNISSNSSGEDDNYITKMTSLDIYEQEQAVIQLRKTTKTNEEARAALCSERLLLALKRLLNSRYAAVQMNATAALVNLSLEKCNKIKIVRAGTVPLLIEILKNGFEESREHAAGAIFSLALEDENKTAIGVLGALQPLLRELRSGTRRSRHDAALALYHLTLVQTNRLKIMKLGAVAVLLGLLKDSEVAARVVLVVCNLATCDEGRVALMDANAVEFLVDLLRSSESVSESTRENCVATLQSLSHGSLRFKALARAAGAAEVLREVAEKGSERTKENVRRILEGLRGPPEAKEGEEVDWEAVMKGGVTRARYRVGKSDGANSTEF